MKHTRWNLVIMGAMVVVALLASMVSWVAVPAEAAASSKRLSVPFLTQLGSAGVAGYGSNNCGPASIAMTMRYFGKSMSVQAAAIAIRGSNDNYTNGYTDFKSQRTINLLTNNNLQQSNVGSYQELQKQISDGNPVVILVDNNKYRSIKPYANDNNAWFTTGHIIVVTGYDKDNVWVNDPLRTQADLKLSVDMFKNAAGARGWYAVAIKKR
jgi:uncharacterized protein YvpB